MDQAVSRDSLRCKSMPNKPRKDSYLSLFLPQTFSHLPPNGSQRLGHEHILWSISWRAKRKIMESLQAFNLLPKSHGTLFCKQPTYNQSCKRCLLVLPRNAADLIDRMTLPPLFITGIKQYWRKIAWQIEKGSLMLPMAFPSYQQVHRGDLHQQSVGDIAHFTKKKYLIRNLFLVLFFHESKGCSCLRRWYENENIS